MHIAPIVAYRVAADGQVIKGLPAGKLRVGIKGVFQIVCPAQQVTTGENVQHTGLQLQRDDAPLPVDLYVRIALGQIPGLDLPEAPFVCCAFRHPGQAAVGLGAEAVVGRGGMDQQIGTGGILLGDPELLGVAGIVGHLKCAVPVFQHIKAGRLFQEKLILLAAFQQPLGGGRAGKGSGVIAHQVGTVAVLDVGQAVAGCQGSQGRSHCGGFQHLAAGGAELLLADVAAGDGGGLFRPMGKSVGAGGGKGLGLQDLVAAFALLDPQTFFRLLQPDREYVGALHRGKGLGAKGPAAQKTLGIAVCSVIIDQPAAGSVGAAAGARRIHAGAQQQAKQR